MSQKRTKKSFLSVPALCWLAIFLSWAVAGILNAQQQPNAEKVDPNAATHSAAKTTFDGVCASCHGLDGRGTERGPDIGSRPEVVHKADAELLQILKQGRIAAGMPSFSSYSPAQLSALVAYLRTLQGRREKAALPGDPARGEVLFFGKATCATCHMVAGRGGFFARDLTSYAQRMSVDEIRTKILDPDQDLDPRRGMVQVTLANSTTLLGTVRNEDNFSLQLQTSDGVFHLLNKADIQAQAYTGKSAMPSDYRATLSSTEINDVISYLLRVSESGNVPGTTNNHNPEDDQEE